MNIPEKPNETPEIPKKTRGRSKEFLAEISKKGNEMQKMRATVNAYEKNKKKKELEEKFNMIQAELAKSKNITPEQSNDTEEIQQQPIEDKKPPIKTKKPKRVVEVIEEVEDETDEEEEEVIVKRIIKKKPIKKVMQVDKDEFIKQTNMQLLKNKFNEDIQQRIRASLFDY